MDETRCRVVCPGMFLLVLMIGGKCSPFRAKAAQVSGHLPTGRRFLPSGIFMGAVYLPRAPGS